MDTRAAAENLGTTPKRLRQFLRSEASTFAAVGSGARYDFTASDLVTMARRFAAWNGKVPATHAPPVDDVPDGRLSQAERDRRVWDEESEVVLEDIRLPNVRRRVQRIARMREARLNEQLLAVGLHVTQRAG